MLLTRTCIRYLCWNLLSWDVDFYKGFGDPLQPSWDQGPCWCQFYLPLTPLIFDHIWKGKEEGNKKIGTGAAKPAHSPVHSHEGRLLVSKAGITFIVYTVMATGFTSTEKWGLVASRKEFFWLILYKLPTSCSAHQKLYLEQFGLWICMRFRSKIPVKKFNSQWDQ